MILHFMTFEWTSLQSSLTYSYMNMLSIAINVIALNKVRFAKANFYNQLLKTEEIKYIPIELNFFFIKSIFELSFSYQPIPDKHSEGFITLRWNRYIQHVKIMNEKTSNLSFKFPVSPPIFKIGCIYLYPLNQSDGI